MACDHLSCPRRSRWRGTSLVLASVGAAALLAAGAARSATPRGPSPRAAAPHYQLTDLGAPEGATTCGATAVNASGQVAGYWRSGGSSPVQGFTWDAAHGMRTLSRPPGALAVLPLSINDAGEIAGVAANGDGLNQAVLWDASGTPHNLGSLAGRDALATGLNNPTSAHSTQVVGTSIGADGRYRPFIWDAQGGMRDIGPAANNEGGLASTAWAINDAGQVTGEAYAAVGSHQYADQTFRWDAGVLQDLDDTDQASVGYDINASGHVVGKLNTTAPGFFTQVLGVWDGSGQTPYNNIQPTVSIEDAATSLIRQLSINAADDVAYTDVNLGGPALFSRGVRWNLTTLTMLPAGYVLKSATDINDAGQIVGTMHTGEAWHAFLLTPANSTPASADLEVTQTASAGTAPVGQSVTYTLIVKNLGADAARVVTLTDTVQGTSEIVSTTPAVTPANGQLTFDLGTLAAGASQTITMTVKGQFAGTITSQAAVSSGDTDPNPANNTVATSVTVTEAPPAAEADLGVTLTASPTVVQVGKSVTLTAVVTNHGPSTASGVTLTPNAGGVALAPISIGAVGLNKPVTRTFTVTPTAAGSLSVTTTVAGNEADASSGDNTASATITVQSVPPTPKPDLFGQWSAVAIVRSGSAKKPVYTLTGTLTVRNGGTATAAATTATFAASTDAVLDSSDLRLQTAPNKPVTLKVPALKAGAGKAFKFSFKLPAGLSPSVLTGLNVIAALDAGNQVAELDETNNLAVSGPIP